jgi:outer membrane protein OmpA-like peptidoglycan-associated protein
MVANASGVAFTTPASLWKDPRVRIRLSRLGLCAISTAIMLAGCSSLGIGGKDGRSEGRSASRGGAALPGTEQSQWVLSGNPLRVDLLALDKTSAKAVTARLRITNFGNGRQQVSQFTDLGGNEVPTMGSASGVTLVDSANRKRYFPWFGTDGKCVCTWEGVLGAYLEPRESFEYFVNFPPPPVRKVMLIFPNTPPFMNVPISDRPGPVKPPPGQQERDPSKVPLRGPEIVPLTDHAEAVDGSLEQDEDDKNVEVRLSADVLFALNKADLTPRAQGALRDVAARINSSKATTVKIDGYTDNSGNDAINVPLSQRRAQAVQQALSQMVTKPGITYQPAGHGSADPVAPNTSEENRKRNRRVTVSFAR